MKVAGLKLSYVVYVMVFFVSLKKDSKCTSLFAILGFFCVWFLLLLFLLGRDHEDPDEGTHQQ